MPKKNVAKTDFQAEIRLQRLVEKELFFNCDFSLPKDTVLKKLELLPHFSLDKNYPSAGGQVFKYLGNKAFYRGCRLEDKKTWLFLTNYAATNRFGLVQSCMNFTKKSDQQEQLKRLQTLFNGQASLKHKVRADLIDVPYDFYECKAFAFNLKASPVDTDFYLIQTQLELFGK